VPRGRTAALAGGAGDGDELDELFSELTDQRERFEPISPAERRTRRARLARLLDAAGTDALLVEHGPTLDYLTGLAWGRSERLLGLVALADGGSFWVLPAFEEASLRGKLAAAGAPAKKLVTWDEHEYAFAPLAAELERRRVERLAAEPSTRGFVLHGLEAAWKRRVLPGVELVLLLRGRKDEHELRLLRAANELTQEAIVAVAERLRPGLKDREIGAWMRRAQERLGLARPWVLPLLGPSAALPHGSPRGKTLARGDTILVDTGGSFLGYQSDCTRSWSFGAAPSATYERVWNVVRDAQRAAFEALVPGGRARDVDAAARRRIAAGGFGAGYESFTHRLGHGIGLEGHEGPYLDGGSEAILAPGMCFSDEPGIYLPGELGVRLEDIVSVTETGADHFGGWQRSPLSPAP